MARNLKRMTTHAQPTTNLLEVDHQQKDKKRCIDFKNRRSISVNFALQKLNNSIKTPPLFNRETSPLTLEGQINEVDAFQREERTFIAHPLFTSSKLIKMKAKKSSEQPKKVLFSTKNIQKGLVHRNATLIPQDAFDYFESLKKDKKRIIESGTPAEVAILLRYNNYKKLDTDECFVTAKDEAILSARATKAHINANNKCIAIYTMLKDALNTFSLFFSEFQKSILYAFNLDSSIRAVNYNLKCVAAMAYHIKHTGVDDSELMPAMGYVLEHSKFINDDKTEIDGEPILAIWERTDGKFAYSINPRCAIFSRIEKANEDLTSQVRTLKGFMMAFSDFIEELNNKAPYMGCACIPPQLFEMTEKVFGELYLTDITDSEQIFESYYNQQREQGKDVETPKTAMIHDIYTADVDTDAYNNLKDYLH